MGIRGGPTGATLGEWLDSNAPEWANKLFDAEVKFWADEIVRARREALEEAAKLVCGVCRAGYSRTPDGHHHLKHAGNTMIRCVAKSIWDALTPPTEETE